MRRLEDVMVGCETVSIIEVEAILSNTLQCLLIEAEGWEQLRSRVL